MSRQELEPSTRGPRPRANTASFAASLFRRPRPDQPSTPPAPTPAPQPPTLSLDALIHALTPSAVPSLAHARALASILATYSPLPRREILNPILISLCNIHSPPSVQAAGYDILSAYWENHEALSLGISERLSYFSLFLGATNVWAIELWEPRFKALRALTKFGEDVLGIESNLIDLLQQWIQGAFEGLIKPFPSIERSEMAERERSIDLLVKFLNNVLTAGTNTARITDQKMADVMCFYAQLVDKTVVIPDPSKDVPSTPVSPSSNTKHSPLGHRRNVSSLSSSSIPNASSSPPPSKKHPAELAINIYLNHVSTHNKALPPAHLNTILPLLFRALAFSSSPLPRLSVMLELSNKKNALEDRIMDTLNSYFGGPYTSMCMLILRFYLFPPGAIRPGLGVEGQFDHLSPALTVLTSLGAHRYFRTYVRRALSARLARAFINRDVISSYSHSGAPGHMEIQNDMMEKAWPKDDYMSNSIGMGDNGWDAGNLGRRLAQSVGAWVDYRFDDAVINEEPDPRAACERVQQGKEEILEEAAGVLKDILQELDLRDDDKAVLDEEEAQVIGVTLLNLAGYVLPLKNPDGTPFIIPMAQPHYAPTRILRTISTLLARDHSRALNPLLSNILIHVAEHLTDADTANLPRLMMEQLDLYPTSPEWLDNWKNLLSNETLVSPYRPHTRRVIMDSLQTVYESVKDMQVYRRPLANIIWRFCGGLVGCPGDQSDDADVMWKMIGEEIVLRSDERGEDDTADMEEITTFLNLLVTVASEKPDEDEDNADTASVNTADMHSPVHNTPTVPSSTSVSPTLSRAQTEYNPPPREKEKETGMPSVMSILSSLATGGNVSRSQSIQPQFQDEMNDTRAETFAPTLPPVQAPPGPLVPRDVSAAAALVEIFSQLVFTPFSLGPKNLLLAVRVYELLLSIITEGKSTRARLTALQFLMRLRADRDHNLYYVSDSFDPHGLVTSLAALINRVELQSTPGATRVMDDLAAESRKARPRFPQEREARQVSRGRGIGGPSRSGPSRSRSRTTAPPLPQPPPKPLEALWRMPETFPFYVSGPDSPSEVLISYDPEGPNRILVLPISKYLLAIDSILEKETSWEILSYVLCHLPVQLSNKHLFCGPRSRKEIAKMLNIICRGIVTEVFASHIEQWPIGLKIRDAHGLAYQTLSVLVSYRRCFDLQQRHGLIEVFYAGLNGTPTTIKCCLHALTSSAFELQPSMTRSLSRILEKLSQIMSNPSMAVHILAFLSVIGSLKDLHVNFTESDFKMVFGVALQFLQHYNRLHAPPTMSWALSQHVRILSYFVVYLWFLSVKLPDRPRHVRYITRQLLLANEGNTEVDEPTEVCFDWLARYTYGSADPRPATSVFSDIVTNPSNPVSDTQTDKTWIMGNSVVTIRSIERTGWVEVMSRRPSGYSRFVCRVENVPMVSAGDVAPDLLSVPAGLVMERDAPHPVNILHDEDEETRENPHELCSIKDPDAQEPPQPDPITGYVWSGTAPSQRRKHVDIDPAFLFLQLSPFPDGVTEPFVKRVYDQNAINRFVRSLDNIPVIDTHKVGIMYVAPGQTKEEDILRNVHGSPAYTRFLEGIGRLINLRGQVDVYAGGLDPDEDGEYAYAWWDDIGQILYHTATMMPTKSDDPLCNNKKRHIGNDYVRIVWNDSALPYRFDTLKTQFQFVNIIIEPHSVGAIAAFSNNIHENEYFKVTIQSAPGMTEFTPIGFFKLISAENLPLLVRQLSLLADWFAVVFSETQRDTERVEMKTNWQARLETIRRFKNQVPRDNDAPSDILDGVMGQEALRDFTTSF
ncbi:hypothetical protein BDN70DRAFT_881149 [Pholiota conissans]|uniref:Rap-GAP domain-containing protein n=1 Tax=Pholiota conissans TaxID=109636 RepID=A0A9P6CRU9_9AGAR|nr:hypothetical protein BDN70DRAFT_881149 [Pholiota conissans]